jgi:hypothetical protein
MTPKKIVNKQTADRLTATASKIQATITALHTTTRDNLDAIFQSNAALDQELLTLKAPQALRAQTRTIEGLIITHLNQTQNLINDLIDLFNDFSEFTP